MAAVRLIEAKMVKARCYYEDQGVEAILSNPFGLSLSLLWWVFLGMLMGDSFFFQRGDRHINAKFSIGGKVRSFRTSQKVYNSLSKSGYFKSEEFKRTMLNGRNH